MFGKILKYEFRSNTRVLLPLYALVIASSALLKLLAAIISRVWAPSEYYVYGIGAGLVGLMAGACALFGIGYVVMSFYRSMVGAEAYLTLTLPVKNSKHILGKYLSSVIFTLLGIACAFLSMYIYNYGSILSYTDSSTNLIINNEALPVGFDITFSQKFALYAAAVVLIIISVAYVIMEIFCACAVGSQFNKKTFASVVSYFVIHNSIGILMVIALILPIVVKLASNVDAVNSFMANIMSQFMANPESAAARIIGYAWLAVGAICLLFLVVISIQFLVTRYLFTKKVNLE